MKTIVQFHPALSIEAVVSHESSGPLSTPSFAYLYVDQEGQQRHVSFDKPRTINVLNVGAVHTDDLKAVFGWLVPGLVDSKTNKDREAVVAATLETRNVPNTDYAERVVRFEMAGRAIEALRAVPDHIPGGNHALLGRRVTRFDA